MGFPVDFPIFLWFSFGFPMVTGGVCHLYRWSPLSVPVNLRTRLAQGAEGAEAALKLGCDGWELPKTRLGTEKLEEYPWNIHGISTEYHGFQWP